MEEELDISTLDRVSEPFQDVRILGIDKSQTVYTVGLFHICLMLSEIPERFWIGCFEQIQTNLYHNSSVFIIKNQSCVLTVTDDNAQKYIDELKKVVSETNKLFREQLMEVEMEKQRILQEQEVTKQRIEELHQRLVI